ncbi:hypothetical protein [Alphaspiravirus yamagawaense]|uniref:Uncharacterized protein n=1 Tax=Alphaspiravirus yamagawaense TaxID=1157339 RepID=J7Q208_9VIRU|nr:hypothetical protein [Aeropyrum coil-shaped virus]CCG27840.1 hypothetical protein [Aeropyrum coil-shaped virus]
MPHPKRVVVEDNLSELQKAIMELHSQGFNRIELHFHGSKRHAREGIKPDFVLVRAFRE